MASISINHVSKSFGRKSVLRDVNLRIENEEFVVLLGPSGCGKTTLLNIIAGLETPSQGSILMQDRVVDDLGPGERDIGFVFQNYALYPNKSVFDNLAFALKFRPTHAPEFAELLAADPALSKQQLIARRVQNTAEALQISELLDRMPHQLSGGQRQRVAMGRALIRKPQAFLLDEPLSNLDAILRVTMRSEIKDLHRKVSGTTVYVTHDQVEAMTLADRVVLLNEGAIQQVGTPHQIYEQPANLFVARFIGTPPINLAHGRIGMEAGRLKAWLCGIPVFLPAMQSNRFQPFLGKDLVFGVRPEDTSLTDSFPVDIKLPATYREFEFLGSHGIATAAIADTVFSIETDKDPKIAYGDKIDIYLNLNALHIFDTASGQRYSSNDISTKS